jgi:ribosomal protein L37AE/L43A
MHCGCAIGHANGNTMPVKKADEPLCKVCGEDAYDMVSATRDGRRIVWHCSMCGASWEPEKEQPKP